MGEPLANYKRVIDAVHRICDPAPDGLGISQRSVTVSTVGLVPAIRKLTEEGLHVRLAVSLHTPDDELTYPLAVDASIDSSGGVEVDSGDFNDSRLRRCVEDPASGSGRRERPVDGG